MILHYGAGPGLFWPPGQGLLTLIAVIDSSARDFSLPGGLIAPRSSCEGTESPLLREMVKHVSDVLVDGFPPPGAEGVFHFPSRWGLACYVLMIWMVRVMALQEKLLREEDVMLSH